MHTLPSVLFFVRPSAERVSLMPPYSRCNSFSILSMWLLHLSTAPLQSAHNEHNQNEQNTPKSKKEMFAWRFGLLFQLAEYGARTHD